MPHSGLGASADYVPLREHGESSRAGVVAVPVREETHRVAASLATVVPGFGPYLPIAIPITRTGNGSTPVDDPNIPHAVPIEAVGSGTAYWHYVLYGLLPLQATVLVCEALLAYAQAQPMHAESVVQGCCIGWLGMHFFSGLCVLRAPPRPAPALGGPNSCFSRFTRNFRPEARCNAGCALAMSYAFDLLIWGISSSADVGFSSPSTLLSWFVAADVLSTCFNLCVSTCDPPPCAEDPDTFTATANAHAVPLH